MTQQLIETRDSVIPVSPKAANTNLKASEILTFEYFVNSVKDFQDIWYIKAKT
jgi:hypothetical protein